MNLMNIYVYIVNAIYYLTKFINKKIKNILLFISCFGLSSWYVLYYIPEVKDFLYSFYYLPGHNLHKRFTFVALLLLLLVSSVDRKIKNIKWNKPLLILYFLFPIGIFIQSFFISVSEELRYCAYELVTVFPCLYLIWNNREDFRNLLYKISISLTLTLNIYYIACIICSFFGAFEYIEDSYRFSGIISNTNNLGFTCVVSIIGSFYMIKINYNRFINYYSLVSISLAIVLLVFSGCRTGMVSVLLSIIAYILFTVFKNNMCDYKKIFKRILINSAFVLLFSIVFYIVTTQMISINNSVLGKNVDTSKYLIANVERLSTENKTINQISSNRIIIWQAYIDGISFSGHDFDDYAYTTPTHRAHNSILETCYFLGIPVGIFYTVFLLLIGFYCVRLLISKKNNNTETLFFIMVSICFAVMSMLEITLELDSKVITLLFYISILKLFNKTNEI